MLIPLGYTDGLLMHGLLALSGSHLTYRKPDDIRLALATSLHYSRLVTGLRIELANLQEDDIEKKQRLLRVLLVASHYEAISGDTDGNIFKHLRASRYLIQSILAHDPTNHGQHTVNQETLGLCLELYAYLVLCNTLTPHGLAPGRALPVDQFITSLESLTSFPTFGTQFAGSHELYQLLPAVSLLASRRLAEEKAGFFEPSSAANASHDELRARLTAWTMPPAANPNEPADDRALRRRAAEALRHALHIYLAAALAGSVVTDPDTRAGLGWHVSALFTATSSLAAARKYFASMLWPILIGGSCIVKPAGQQALLESFASGGYQMRQLETLGRVLSLLWADPDPRAYGSYGLYFIMEKHGLNVANA